MGKSELLIDTTIHEFYGKNSNHDLYRRKKDS